MEKVKVMKSRRIRWKVYVACTEGMRAPYQVFIGKHLYVGDLYVNMRVILKWTIQ
jgi:hypothetical protein